jgi:hypothetical protein
MENNDIGIYPLDPLTTILKLLLLSYLPTNTKVSIFPCKIYFQQPGLIQTFSRAYYHDERNHLYRLKDPISKFIEIYKPFEETDSIQYFTQGALDGIKHLIDLYSTSNDGAQVLIHALEHYQKILLESMDKKSTEIEDIADSDTSSNAMNYNNKVSSLWSNDEINVVYLQLRLLDSKKDTESFDSWFNSAKIIVDCKEDELKIWWNSLFDSSIRSR